MRTTTPPLLLIHGAWHGKWCFERYFADYLRQQGFDVHTIDLPEHGEKFTSVRNQRWLSIGDYVETVAAYVAAMPALPVLVGHSMGGLVVQKYLEMHPARAGVLLASVPPAGVWRVTRLMLLQHPLRFFRTILTLNLQHAVSDVSLVRELFFSAEITPANLKAYFSSLHGESYRAFLDMLLLALPRP